jgi:NitT/TauT family transport system substrate-binding protein
MQAILLQIAARDLFGDANWAKLDPMTVSMAHPDSVAAVLSGAGDIESHFSSPPFQARELAAPGVRTVVSSYDIIGGAHAVSNITMTAKFRSQNPKTVAALMSALAEATEWVKRDRKFAAEAYIRVTKDKTPVDDLVKIIDEANIEFTLAPRGAQRVADFLHHIGSIKAKPADWREMYFPEAHGLPGN